MEIFTRLAVLSTLALVTACGDPQDDTRLQEQVINGFYQQHLKTHSPGIPSADELKQLQPFLSQTLFSLLSQAADIDARYHAAAESLVPPLVDGDLFTSLFEGATSFAVDSCEHEGDHASCLVRFRYAGNTGDNKGVNESWKDKLLLIKQQQQWRIDDIEFIGSGQSSQREYLTDTLDSIIKNTN
jgi:hypothetical protein